MYEKRVKNPTVSDLYEGNYIEGTYNGKKFSGTVRIEDDSLVYVGDVLVNRLYSMSLEPGVVLTEGNAKFGGLPTKPGTVGRATVRGIPNTRIMRTKRGAWLSYETIDNSRIHQKKQIDVNSFVFELEGE